MCPCSKVLISKKNKKKQHILLILGLDDMAKIYITIYFLISVDTI